MESALCGQTIDQRAEILRALETIGYAATAKQVYSCCPAFQAESAVRQELWAMSREGLVRVVSEITPARFALAGATSAGESVPESRIRRGAIDDDDDAPVHVRRAGSISELPRPAAEAMSLSPSEALELKNFMVKLAFAHEGRAR